MRLELFTPDLSNRHEITHTISFQMSYYYNDIGKFTAILPLDEYNAKISKTDSVLYVVELGVAFEVAETQVDIDESQITLNGFTLNNRLERRVIASEASIINVEKDLYKAISDNLRGLPVEIAKEKGLTETISPTSIGADSLISGIKPVLSSAGLGQRAVFDYKNKKIVFEIYKGDDLTEGIHSVAFVQERGTAPGLQVDKDISTYKNVCYCTAQYKDGTKFTAVAGTAEGENRRELIAEFSGDSQGDDESNEDFFRRVQSYAALQLGSHLNRTGFSVNCSADELGNAYNVGDLVWCVSLFLGVKFKARITGAKFTQDNNGQSMNLVIGDPVQTVIMR